MAQEVKQTAKEERKLIRIPVESSIGKVGITEEVLAVMAGIAAMEIEGVASVNRTATRQLIAKLGMKSLADGVRVSENNGAVSVRINLNLDYGVSVGDVSGKVQEKVKASIENMTGLAVETVDVSIAGVELPAGKSKS
ncbi:MAG: Asp23/Gls24 family envelope stress response protein [Lachnospiraceae bacterium]|nr:Asp23/Gls24 family envelope stress response protein [Lachnospiraceae bacterium]